MPRRSSLSSSPSSTPCLGRLVEVTRWTPPPLPTHRYLVRSFRLILPFFPTGTMERVDKEGQVVTAKVWVPPKPAASMLALPPPDPGHHAVSDPTGHQRTSSDHHLRHPLSAGKAKRTNKPGASPHCIFLLFQVLLLRPGHSEVGSGSAPVAEMRVALQTPDSHAPAG